jgi:hypothetical protein
LQATFVVYSLPLIHIGVTRTALDSAVHFVKRNNEAGLVFFYLTSNYRIEIRQKLTSLDVLYVIVDFPLDLFINHFIVRSDKSTGNPKTRLKTMKRLIAFAVLFWSIALMQVFSVKGAPEVPQSAQVVIYMQKLPAWAEQPLEVQKMVVSNQAVEDSKLFEADDFWMKDLTITVKNVSKRTIQGFNLALQFSPDVKLAEVELSKGLSFGIESAGHEINLAPGESTQVSVTASWFDALKFHVMHMELPPGALRSVTLKVKEVYFDINHAWFRGFFVIRDANNPERFIPDESQRSKTAKFMYEQKLRDNAKQVKSVAFVPRALPVCIVYTESLRVPCT